MKSIKDMLLKTREELVQGIARKSKETAVSGVSDIGDILDSVSEERTRELYMIFIDREKQKLKQIDTPSTGSKRKRTVFARSAASKSRGRA